MAAFNSVKDDYYTNLFEGIIIYVSIIISKKLTTFMHVKITPSVNIFKLFGNMTKKILGLNYSVNIMECP